MSNPYHRIGLRRNPFINLETLYIPINRWVDFGFSQPPPRQSCLFWQVLGEKGAGKTSHLLHWHEKTKGIYYYCPKGWLSWQFPPISAIAYWDEADRIPLLILLFSLISAKGCRATIVVSTHRNVAWIAGLLGFSLRKIYLSTLSVENLISLLEIALKAEQLSLQIPIPLTLTLEQAEEIVQKSQGSWRKAANYLHIWVAKSCQAQSSLGERG